MPTVNPRCAEPPKEYLILHKSLLLSLILVIVGLPTLCLGIALGVLCPSVIPLVGPTLIHTDSVAVCTGGWYLRYVMPWSLIFLAGGACLIIAAGKVSVFAVELEVGPSEWQLWWLVFGCWKVMRARGASAGLAAKVRSNQNWN